MTIPVARKLSAMTWSRRVGYFGAAVVRNTFRVVDSVSRWASGTGLQSSTGWTRTASGLKRCSQCGHRTIFGVDSPGILPAKSQWGQRTWTRTGLILLKRYSSLANPSYLAIVDVDRGLRRG